MSALHVLGLPAFLLLAVMGCNEESHDVPPGEDVLIGGQHSFVPSAGYVPAPDVAIAIGEAVLVPIYGENPIRRQRPFNARLEDDVWVVRGSLPRDHLGGVAEVHISRVDGTIMRVTHGL